MRGLYLRRRHDRPSGIWRGLGWALIVIGVLALAPPLGGLLFGGLVGIFGLVVGLIAVAVTITVVLTILGLTGAALAAPFVALVGAPYMMFRGFFVRCCPPWMSWQQDEDRVERRRPQQRSYYQDGLSGQSDRWSQPPAQRDPATEVLRQRYAAGELTQGDFQEHLIDLLKERYVGGKIDQTQYEQQLQVLVRPPSPERQLSPSSVQSDALQS